MGVFNNIEKRLEDAVSGVFAKAFKGDVQPVEIAARLTKELDAEAKLLSRHAKLVPNDFTIGLSPHDYDRLAPYGKTLSAEIVPDLKAHAHDNGYVFNGPVIIRLELNERLSTGRFTVASHAVAADDSDAESIRIGDARADDVIHAGQEIVDLVVPPVGGDRA